MTKITLCYFLGKLLFDALEELVVLAFYVLCIVFCVVASVYNYATCGYNPGCSSFSEFGGRSPAKMSDTTIQIDLPDVHDTT